VLLSIAALVLIVAGTVAYNIYRDSQLYVSTDNAELTGQPIQVGSMNAGRVEAILPTIGSRVHRGDVVAQVALPTQIGIAQNGQPKMGFLGASDTQVDVQAPVDGVVIAIPVGIGATVAAGQAIVTLVDPSQLWVNANVEETNFARLKIGQSAGQPHSKRRAVASCALNRQLAAVLLNDRARTRKPKSVADNAAVRLPLCGHERLATLAAKLSLLIMFDSHDGRCLAAHLEPCRAPVRSILHGRSN
jgi:multidrug efflux pump subunit AcrA (membrane-fusion protein)